jgi:hypothetical protein
MVQAKLDGFVVRVDRRGKVAQTPESYILAIRGGIRGRWIELSLLDRLKPAMSEGAQRGTATRMMKIARQRAERHREILQLLRVKFHRRIFSQALYGAFVESCATQGWPIIGTRRFAQVLAELEHEGWIRREVRSFGRFGRRTIVQIRTSVGRTTGENEATNADVRTYDTYVRASTAVRTGDSL